MKTLLILTLLLVGCSEPLTSRQQEQRIKLYDSCMQSATSRSSSYTGMNIIMNKCNDISISQVR